MTQWERGRSLNVMTYQYNMPLTCIHLCQTRINTYTRWRKKTEQFLFTLIVFHSDYIQAPPAHHAPLRSLQRSYSYHCCRPPSCCLWGISAKLSRASAFQKKIISSQEHISLCGAYCSLRVQRGDADGTASDGPCPPTQPSQYSTWATLT